MAPANQWPKTPGLLRKIEEDRPRLEDGDGLPTADGVCVDRDRHSVVGVECEEARVELISPTDVARDDVVSDARLLRNMVIFFPFALASNADAAYRSFLAPRYLGSLVASRSTCSIFGGSARSSAAFDIRAAAIGPFR